MQKGATIMFNYDGIKYAVFIDKSMGYWEKSIEALIQTIWPKS